MLKSLSLSLSLFFFSLSLSHTFLSEGEENISAAIFVVQYKNKLKRFFESWRL